MIDFFYTNKDCLTSIVIYIELSVPATILHLYMFYLIWRRYEGLWFAFAFGVSLDVCVYLYTLRVSVCVYACLSIWFLSFGAQFYTIYRLINVFYWVFFCLVRSVFCSFCSAIVSYKFALNFRTFYTDHIRYLFIHLICVYGISQTTRWIAFGLNSSGLNTVISPDWLLNAFDRKTLVNALKSVMNCISKNKIMPLSMFAL